MDTKAMREFPDALRGVQFQTIRRQKVCAETSSHVPPQVPVQSGVVISGVVGNHHRFPRHHGCHD